MAKPSSRHLGYRKAYNLRPLPVKRQLIGEENRDEGEEACTAHHKRRKVVFPRPRRNSQQGESELSRSRKPRLSRKKTTKDNDNASGADKRPAHSGAATLGEWPMADAVLKCIRQHGTVMFQLQFTSDALWKTVAGSCDSAAENRQPPKNVEHRRPTTRREQPKQPTENVVQSIQSAFPSVCPDIYRMDCFLTRWRQHTFLVKWPDATTTWEPRKHIIDKKELSKFEEHWQGLDAGVDVLEVRLRAGKRPHLLHLHGRPSKEDT